MEPEQSLMLILLSNNLFQALCCIFFSRSQLFQLPDFSLGQNFQVKSRKHQPGSPVLLGAFAQRLPEASLAWAGACAAGAHIQADRAGCWSWGLFMN